MTSFYIIAILQKFEYSRGGYCQEVLLATANEGRSPRRAILRTCGHLVPRTRGQNLVSTVLRHETKLSNISKLIFLFLIYLITQL